MIGIFIGIGFALVRPILILFFWLLPALIVIVLFGTGLIAVNLIVHGAFALIGL